METIENLCPDDVNLVAENEVEQLARACQRTDAFLRRVASGLPEDGDLLPDGDLDPLLFFEEWRHAH
jgi:hypothetical protein